MMDILNSIGESQVKCKEWLLQHLTPTETGVVLGGWYGGLAYTLGYLSVDVDRMCSRYGMLLYPDVHMKTEDAFVHLMMKKNPYGTVICTSCEHMDQEDLDMFNHMPGTQFCLQSNNWEGIAGHINCKESLEEFASEYDFDFTYKGELDMGGYKRWMVIGSTK